MGCKRPWWLDNPQTRDSQAAMGRQFIIEAGELVKDVWEENLHSFPAHETRGYIIAPHFDITYWRHQEMAEKYGMKDDWFYPDQVTALGRMMRNMRIPYEPRSYYPRDMRNPQYRTDSRDTVLANIEPDGRITRSDFISQDVEHDP